MWTCIIEKAALSYIDTNIGPSTKYHEHARRTVKLKQSPNVFINLENSIGGTFQQAFLSKISKKQCFIELLMRAFSANGHDILQRRGDADTSIVSTILDFACLGKCLFHSGWHRSPNNADLYVERHDGTNQTEE